MKRIWYSAPALSAMLLCMPLARAQSSFDLNMGFGTAHASATGSGIENASSATAFSGCSLANSDGFCQATPTLGGFFLGFGGDLMLQKHFGVGAEASLQPAKSDFGPLQYRQQFYDFDGIVAPVNDKRVSLRVTGGLGEARTGFSYLEASCVGTAVCASSSQSVGHATHLQVHTGVGLQVFLKGDLFVRPQFDLHYVRNLDQQFGSNLVPEAAVWVGYSWGRER